MNTRKKILLSTFLIWLVGTIYGVVTCGWMFYWVYQIPPIIWKSPEALMDPANMTTGLVLGFVVSLIFVYVFSVLKGSVPGHGVKKGLNYGLLIWMVGALSGIPAMPVYMTISTTVVVYWIISALIANLIYGAIVGSIIK